MGRAALLLAVGFSGMACAPLHRGAPTDQRGLPQSVGFVVFTTPQDLKPMLEMRKDATERKGRWWRMGNGLASVRVTDARGRSLHGVECGGVLFISGASGPCRVQVHNKTSVRAEIMVSANGRDVLTGAPVSWEQPGLLVGAHASAVFPPFPALPVAGPKALFRQDVEAQPGVVRITLDASAGGRRPPVYSSAWPYDYR